MKVFTVSTNNTLNRRMRFLGILLTALMVPATMISQSPAVVNLGTAGGFAVIAKTGISTTGTTSITGDIGLSPAAATLITGFGLIMHSSGTYATSSLLVGKAYASDYTTPTPTKMTTAIGDMETAYTDAAGRVSPDYTELYAGDVTGQTLTPGLYKWGTGVLVSAAGVTISGSPTDVWIFQIAQDLTVANSAIVTLSGGALASNIFWQVAGQVTLGTSAQMKGIILCQTQIAMSTGASLDGRALAQTAVTTDGNAVTEPAAVTSVENGSASPEGFSLSQNYPNPFNPSTKIEYRLEKAARVSLKIYNVLGNEITTLVNGRQEAGSYTVSFNSRRANLTSGTYLYRLEAGSLVSVKKFILLK